MKAVVLLYNTCCIYEIVTLNYFLNFSGREVAFVSVDGKSVTSMEGYPIRISEKLDDMDAAQTSLMVVPGGNIRAIDTPAVWAFLRQVHAGGGLIAGICAGVDVLEHAGLLDGIASTHSAEPDVVVTDRVITSRANGYVDFALEVAKKMNLFADEADLQETIAFWKHHQRMQ